MITAEEFLKQQVPASSPALSITAEEFLKQEPKKESFVGGSVRKVKEFFSPPGVTATTPPLEATGKLAKHVATQGVNLFTLPVTVPLKKAVGLAETAIGPEGLEITKETPTLVPPINVMKDTTGQLLGHALELALLSKGYKLAKELPGAISSAARAPGVLSKVTGVAKPVAESAGIAGAFESANILQSGGTLEEAFIGGLQAAPIGPLLAGAGTIVAPRGIDPRIEQKLRERPTREIPKEDIVPTTEVTAPGPVNLFRGTRREGQPVVDEVSKDFGKVKVVEGDQVQLLNELAIRGSETAKRLLADTRPSSYVEADSFLRGVYGEKFDAIQYKNGRIPEKGIEYHDLKTNEFLSTSRDTAEVYSLQNRGAKMEDVNLRPRLEEVHSEGLAFSKRLESPQTVLPQPLPEQLRDRTIRVETINRIVDEVRKRIDTNLQDPILQDRSRRVFERMAQRLSEGEYLPEDVVSIFHKMGLIPEEIARDWKNTFSTAGKILNRASQLAKELDATFQEAPKEVRNIVEQLSQRSNELSDNPIARAARFFARVEHLRRGFLVTQLATAVRNAVSQSARFSLNVFEDTLSGFAEAATGKRPVKEAFAYAVQDVMALMRKLSPKARESLNKTLQDIPDEAFRLLHNPAEVSLGGRLVSFLNTFNTLQEHFFRKLIFDATLAAKMERSGKKSYKELSQVDFEEAISRALESTFSKTPTKADGAWFTVWDSPLFKFLRSPVGTALGNPFPRFMINGMRFIVDYNPIGFARLFGPEFRKKLLSEDPEVQYRALAKATIGTMMLGAAVALREQDEWRGEKWYEIKVGNKRYDVRSFAPFSQYLFIAEVMRQIRGEKTDIKPKDFLEAAISINRVAGTGLAIIDWFRTDDPETIVKSMKRILGTWMSGFTVPFTTINDFLSAFDVSDTKTRDVREAPFVGPIIRNIPVVREVLPEKPSITRGVPFETENPTLKQMGGLRYETRTPFEEELIRLNIESFRYFPNTGIPELDRDMARIAGKEIRSKGEKLVVSPSYMRADDETQQEQLKKLMSNEKKKAKAKLLQQHRDWKKQLEATK